MRFYHFTGLENLRAIGQHGLTVGDVPTDIERWRGVVGVWLTGMEEAEGHGLDGSAINKKRVRLTVEIEDGDTKLAKWTEWASKRVSPSTLRILHRAGGESFESWYVYFGWIKPEQISRAFDTAKGEDIPSWPTAVPEHLSDKGVPFWRRDTWHKRLLKEVRKASAPQR